MYNYRSLLLLISTFLMFNLFLNFSYAADTNQPKGKLNHLTKYTDTYDYDKVLNDKYVKTGLKNLLGKDLKHLKTNLATIIPISHTGNFLILQGLAAHRGGEEEAIILINIMNGDIQSAILTKNKVLLFSNAKSFESLPEDLRQWIYTRGIGNDDYKGPTNKKPGNVVWVNKK